MLDKNTTAAQNASFFMLGYTAFCAAGLQSVLVLVSHLLHDVAEGSADQCALKRLVMIDERAGGGADQRAARFTVVMAVVNGRDVVATVMTRRCESTFSRNEQRKAENGCLNLSHRVCHE